MEARGCRIPQEAFEGGKTANNVITGEFARAGQKDWATLCSKGGTSSILLFWGGPTTCPSELRPDDDAKYFQGDTYSRGIRAVDEADLQGFDSPPAEGLMTHQGIEDAFTGKVSTVVSCINGKWQEVASAGASFERCPLGSNCGPNSVWRFVAATFR